MQIPKKISFIKGTAYIIVLLFLAMPFAALADCKGAAWKRFGKISSTGEATYSQSMFDAWNWACRPASECPEKPSSSSGQGSYVSKRITKGGVNWEDTGCTAEQICCGVQIAAGTAEQAPEVQKLVTPKLNITIPGLQFSDEAYVENNQVYIPFLAQYINAFFKYILGISLVATAIMLVWGGMLYIYGSTGLQVSDAKKKITDAVIGLVIILGAYVIIANINPNLTSLGAIKFTKIEKKVYKALESVNSSIPNNHAIDPSAGAIASSKSIIAGNPVAGARCNAADKVVNFKQAGGDWGSKPFGKQRVCTHGEEFEVQENGKTVKKKASDMSNAPCCQPYGESACGITSLANVLASYGANVTPGSLGDLYISAGHRNCNYGGSSPTLGLEVWQKKLGISDFVTASVDKTETAIDEILKNGNPIIFLCSGCKTCKQGNAGQPICHVHGGHWMVLTGVYDNGTYGIADPSRGDYTFIDKKAVLSGQVGSLILIKPKDGHGIQGCPR